MATVQILGDVFLNLSVLLLSLPPNWNDDVGWGGVTAELAGMG